MANLIRQREGRYKITARSGTGFIATVIGIAVVVLALTGNSTMAFSGDSTPTATPFSPVRANKDWRSQVKTFNGVEMVLVPPGCFMIGTSDADIAKQQGNPDEAPQTKICFEAPFWLDKNDVTNGQFKQFNGKAANPGRWTGDNRPREHITWFEARDFCALRGGRLPTEAEWEYAARGPDGLVYPWGNSFSASNTVYSVNSDDQTADVGNKPGGASWVGALDMAGNVWQWTNSRDKPYPYNKEDGRESNSDTDRFRVLRGGSYNNNEYELRSAGRVDGAPDYYYVIGFRCARAFDTTSTVATTATPISGTPRAAASAVKDNRQMDDSPHQAGYQRVNSLTWIEQAQRGKLLHIKDFPQGHQVKLFRLVLSSKRTDYIATDDLAQASTQAT